MSATVLYMSLDGFVAGPNEGPDNGLGDGGERQHDWSMTGGAGGCGAGGVRLGGRELGAPTSSGASASTPAPPWREG